MYTSKTKGRSEEHRGSRIQRVRHKKLMKKIFQEDSYVTGLRQVDGGFWKDASRKKMEPSDYLMC